MVVFTIEVDLNKRHAPVKDVELVISGQCRAVACKRLHQQPSGDASIAGFIEPPPIVVAYPSGRGSSRRIPVVQLAAKEATLIAAVPRFQHEGVWPQWCFRQDFARPERRRDPIASEPFCYKLLHRDFIDQCWKTWICPMELTMLHQFGEQDRFVEPRESAVTKEVRHTNAKASPPLILGGAKVIPPKPSFSRNPVVETGCGLPGDGIGRGFLRPRRIARQGHILSSCCGERCSQNRGHQRRLGKRLHRHSSVSARCSP